MYVTRKTAQAQATREALERLARELFAERGFAAVSAEELVARAGLTRGALYHHYGGKEGLFAAVVEATMRDVHTRLAAAAAGQADPLRGLARGIATFLDLCAEPAIRRILLEDAPAVLGWHAWREMDARYGLGLLKEALAAAMRAGLLHDQDPHVLAHLLLGALTEAAMLLARSSTPAGARGAAERALLSVIDGWRAAD